VRAKLRRKTIEKIVGEYRDTMSGAKNHLHARFGCDSWTTRRFYPLNTLLAFR
jgi:hypothetical protein